jgi:hypothetical protein
MPTHGELRLGMLTSSTAGIIMRGGPAAWDSLREHLWTDTAEEFDGDTEGARAFGHEEEDKGVAKFWERHPEVEAIEPGGFQIYRATGVLKDRIGSSPDRIVYEHGKFYGLEVKSPTIPGYMGRHTPVAHNDQCQHGALVTGFKKWVLVAHHGETLYEEYLIKPDRDWQKRYLDRAEVFIKFAYEGKPVIRRKLSINDLKD